MAVMAIAKKKGLFITFEGLDGCGKSTQLARLHTALTKAGRTVVTTREPGGTPIGERVREVLLDSRTKGLAPLTELALMFASRAQQIAENILPNVEAGHVVLCDRFTDSSEAYQGYGRGLGSEKILGLHRLLCGNLQPDVTFLLMSEVSTVERARQRNSRKTKTNEGRFEQEEDAFFLRVRKGYQAIAKRDGKRVVAIDASQTIAQVHAHIVNAMIKRGHLPSRKA